MSNDDRYKYFRIEARELLASLSQGVLAIEKGSGGKDVIGRMLRHAHTLKGASRIVGQDAISELSHSVEDILSPHRDAKMPVPGQKINELLGLLDAMAERVGQLEAGDLPGVTAHQIPTPKPTRSPDDSFETVRIGISDMDALLHESAQANVDLRALTQEAVALERAIELAGSISADGLSGRTALVVNELQGVLRRLRQTLGASTERAQRQIERVQERSGELRLLPAAAVLSAMERVARDAAEALGKKVDFRTHGGETRLDAHILRALSDALSHVVRNAVAHGVETETDRRAASKPPHGRVELRVERRGNRVVLTCEDDGSGIDVEQVRRAAVERGLVSVAQVAALDSDGAIDLLRQGGLTTSRALTPISGRGVGLDVVRHTILSLKGDWSITTEAGRGTKVKLVVPISLEALSVLEVEVAGSVASIPFEAVAAGQRVAPKEIARSPRGDSIVYNGKTVPFLPLASLLKPGSTPVPQPKAWSVVLVNADEKLAAVGVDRLLRRRSVVIRPLPTTAGSVELVAGASFDNEGNPQLVIDPTALVGAVCRHTQAAAVPTTLRKLPLLVIDDSLTTRMLEQSILETAGYEVDLAVSAEEALEKARNRNYAMFVVDVEMPGMDGFEFIERVQSDMQLRHIPCILVTSRASPEDRRRGEQVGARDYIIKSEFDEGHLLRTIRNLVG